MSTSTIPLAERMRPTTLDEFVGQKHLLGDNKLLARLIKEEHLPSMILWGPPGTGKTTLARILSQSTSADFIHFSAVLSGVKEIREIVKQAELRKTAAGKATVLFVDEIHRFNKSQQDAFLPHVETGLLTLIGATTENPSFQVIAPLLSRCRVVVINPLPPEDLGRIIDNCLADTERGLGSTAVTMDQKARDHLIRLADGDARNLLNSLEIAVSLTEADADGKKNIPLAMMEEALQRSHLRYDANGEEHYNLISALHKSLRDSDPDGGLYWLLRMLTAGEDPLYICRRMIRFASEDIGNADPQALTVALNAQQSFRTLGSPEGDLALVQAAVYLATAPKSNALYIAEKAARKDIRKTGSLAVPMHLRNAPTSLMDDLGYGHGYQYAHDQNDALTPQEHMPDELTGKIYYTPTNRGYEAVVKDRLTKWRKILQEKRRQPKRK